MPGTPFRLSATLLLCAAFTSSWSAVHVGSYQLVDYLLIACTVTTCVTLGLTNNGFHLPGWGFAAPVTVIAVLVADVAVPPSSAYLSSRIVLSAASADPASVAVTKGAQWLVALVIVPLLVGTIVQHRPALIRQVLMAWMAGAALSATVAWTDYEGFTRISTNLGTYIDTGGRQAGLTSQANSVGAAAAITVPLAVYLMAQRRWRVLGLLCVLALAVGAIVSGSRGGQAVFALAVAFTVFTTRSGRRTAPFVLATVVATVYWLLSSRQYVSGSANIFRLFSSASASADASDAGRSQVAAQALQDFGHRPFFGIGLDQITAAHRIYYQILASGGVVLALGFANYVYGAIRNLWQVRLTETFAPYALICLGSWLAIGLVENNLTDRFLYFPIGVAAAVTVRSANAVRAADPLRRNSGYDVMARARA